MTNPAVTVIRADARALPLADASIDLIVTSPPYFALRSYSDGGEHYAGQIGSEATPGEFLDALAEVTRECMRVLKPTGSLWVNLGDKYAGSPRNMPTHNGTDPRMASSKFSRERLSAGDEYRTDVRPKSLLGIPWRYALRCIDDLGLILRAEIIWSKPNGLPESVTDRVRRSHEQWFHFVRQPRYFAAVDEIREQYAPGTAARYAAGYGRNDYQTGNVRKGVGVDYSGTFDTNPLGKLPGSVWTVPTQPLTVPAHLGVDHFAAFPMEWPRRIIAGWSPTGICTACGEGRRPVVATDIVGKSVVPNLPQAVAQGIVNTGGAPAATWGVRALDIHRAITGYACACPTPDAPTTPAVVLDPFGGTGTTALVAHALGRQGISVDLSADYCRLAEWRTSDRGEIARVLGVPKPPVEIPGQADLFAEPDEEAS